MSEFGSAAPYKFSLQQLFSLLRHCLRPGVHLGTLEAAPQPGSNQRSVGTVPLTSSVAHKAPTC
eukprot:1144605-Pelagomonas_calceolata.AAC.2